MATTDYTLAYYYGDRKTGNITLISNQQGATQIKPLPAGADSGLDKLLKPIFIGVTNTAKVVILDPKSKQLSLQDEFPVDAFAAHDYADPTSSRVWFMNDGDKETGNDTLNCGNEGSSVSVVENVSRDTAKFLSTICVGRGHHQANFTYPSDQAPDTPRYAVISNLKDGSLSVIGNDPDKTDTYLKNIATINLCESDKEETGQECMPNSAFPHGLAFSPVTGKLYNLNNGYGTVAVINPCTLEIEERFAFKGHSNLFASPCGRYIIGRGADRKSDAKHVIAKVSVYDVVDKKVSASMDLQDIYISKYFFNPEGSKLYLTTSSSGSDEQMANLKTDALLIFDMKALPEIKLLREHRLGSPAGTLDFHQENGISTRVFSSNAANGEAVVLDGQNDDEIERLKIGDSSPHSRLWLIK